MRRSRWILLPALMLAASGVGAQTRFITVAGTDADVSALTRAQDDIAIDAAQPADVHFTTANTSMKVRGGDYLTALGIGAQVRGDTRISAVRSARRSPDAYADRSGHLPEPATWAMMVAGFGMMAAAVRRGLRISEARFTARIRRIEAGDLN